MADLRVKLGNTPIELKNPVVCGSGEFTMHEAGIESALNSGAGAVIAKSVNERPESAELFKKADYALVSGDWRPRPWDQATDQDSLIARSGLPITDVEGWIDTIGRLDRRAAEMDSYVIGSIVVTDPGPATEIAASMQSRVRCMEVNLGAPHGREGKEHGVRDFTDPADVRQVTEQIRRVVSCPMIVKIAGQAVSVSDIAEAAVEGGADMVTMMDRFPGFVPDIDTWEPVLGSWGVIGGNWAMPVTLYWISKMHRLRPDVPLVGTNGARSGLDVVRFMLSGATAVQMTSAVLMRGAAALSDAIETLNSYLDARGTERVRDLIGAAARQARYYAEIESGPDHRPWEALYSAAPSVSEARG